MRILLIEDDPVVAQSIELMLSTGPFEVETTSLGGMASISASAIAMI
jgi:DNA-binding response OmpR family regulator